MLYYFFRILVLFPAGKKKNAGMIFWSTFKVSTKKPQFQRLRPPKVKFQEEIFHETCKISELDEI